MSEDHRHDHTIDVDCLIKAGEEIGKLKEMNKRLKSAEGRVEEIAKLTGINKALRRDILALQSKVWHLEHPNQ